MFEDIYLNRMNNMLIKAVFAIGAIFVLLFAACSSVMPTNQDVSSSSSSIVLESQVTWVKLQGRATKKLKYDPKIKIFNNKLYEYTSDDSLYEDGKGVYKFMNEPNPMNLDTALGSLWAINSTPLELTRIQPNGKISNINLDKNVICPNDTSVEICAGLTINEWNDELVFMVARCSGGGICKTHINCAKVNADSVYGWHKCLDGFDTTFHGDNTYVPASSVNFKGKLYAPTWDNGIVRWDGAQWEAIPQITVYKRIAEIDYKLRRFRTNPVIHNGELIIMEIFGYSVKTSDGDNWGTFANTERVTAVNNPTLPYAIRDTVDVYDFASGMLSYNGDLYYGAGLFRRNFKDSLWQFAIRPKTVGAYKEFTNGFTPFSPPGMTGTIAARNDTLFAEIVSIVPEYTGLWALDLTKFKDTSWVSQRK